VFTANANGYYWGKYKPKLAGKFFIRTRCLTNDTISRTAILTVNGTIAPTQLVLASTTSTKDSGLFERIGPVLEQTCPEYVLKATFVGSGAAIALGGSGDADVLLTHSPKAEVDFMNGIVAGSPSMYGGLTRYKVMYNDYVLVGPKSNPAGVGATVPAATAFQAIATAGSTFWSRNDKSGTNEKEKSIWASLGNPQIGQSWYKASGTMGMAQALAAANDASTGGYTLSDRATWLNGSSLGIAKNLKIVNSGDAKYFNQYSVIEVKGARNGEGAQDFSNWIRSPEAQDLIGTFGEYTYPGQVMFVPNAGSY
jgi:tungstate transport system substrate-binding protein